MPRDGWNDGVGKGSARNEGEPTYRTFASLLFYFELAGIVLSFGISNNFFFFVPSIRRSPASLTPRSSDLWQPPLLHSPLPLRTTAVLSAVAVFFFLSFFPASGLHNTGSNPTLSDLLFPSFSLAVTVAPQPSACSSVPTVVYPRFPLNNNYSAILSALLYRKRKEQRRSRGWMRVERRRGRTDG